MKCPYCCLELIPVYRNVVREGLPAEYLCRNCDLTWKIKIGGIIAGVKDETLNRIRDDGLV